VNAAWLLWLGMVRLGYSDDARHVARTLERTILTAGMREYYNPHTAEGLGALDFAWTGLILEMGV
jgi:hypothetical protein